jgi:hypothetical protein
MLINSISDFRRAMRHGPFTGLGGYPVYFIMSDGEALSFEAARKERRLILEALAEGDKWGGWLPYALDVNYEDSALYCAHTGDKITSAYADN